MVTLADAAVLVVLLVVVAALAYTVAYLAYRARVTAEESRRRTPWLTAGAAEDRPDPVETLRAMNELLREDLAESRASVDGLHDAAESGIRGHGS